MQKTNQIALYTDKNIFLISLQITYGMLYYLYIKVHYILYVYSLNSF